MNKSDRRLRISSVLLLLLGLSILLSLQDCLVFQQKHEPRTVITIGGVLADRINPILVSESSLVAIDASIFDGLIRINEQMEIIPHLAERWNYRPDQKELIIYLRKNVKFHDGVEFTAADVKFTYDAIMDPNIGSYYASEFESIDRIEVEGKYRLRIYFKEPNANFLYTLRINILPKHLLSLLDLQNPNLGFNHHPIGTGAYKVAKWTEDVLVLESNPEYFLGKPKIDQVIVRSIPNPTQMWAQLMTERIDVMEDILPQDYQVLLANPKLQGYKTPTGFYYMVSLNNKQPLFSDPRVRKALNYAIDKQAIVDEVLLGEGSICGSIFPPNSNLYNRSILPYEYRPRIAQSLLRDAGWVQDKKTRQLKKNGIPFEFTLLIDGDNTLKRQIALILDQQLQELGIKMHLKSLPVSTLVNEYLLTKRFEACIAEIGSLYETNFGYVFYHSEQIQKGLNAQSYQNQRVDGIYNLLQNTVNPETRKKYFEQLQQELAQNPPGIFLFYPHHLSGVNKKFANIKPRSDENILWNLREWVKNSQIS